MFLQLFNPILCALKSLFSSCIIYDYGSVSSIEEILCHGGVSLLARSIPQKQFDGPASVITWHIFVDESGTKCWLDILFESSIAKPIEDARFADGRLAYENNLLCL